MSDARSSGPFAWETLLRDESELVRRARVPGGWLVSHLLRTDPPLPASLAFVPDAGHKWSTAMTSAPEAFADTPTDTVETGHETLSDELSEASKDVVATGAAGVVTTQAELDCFNVIKEIVEAARPEAHLGFLDTPTYFGIYIGGPSRWIARLVVTPRSSWLALNLSEDEAEDDTLSGQVPLPGNWASQVRFGLTRAEDLRPLAPLILKAVAKVL